MTFVSREAGPSILVFLYEPYKKITKINLVSRAKYRKQEKSPNSKGGRIHGAKYRKQENFPNSKGGRNRGAKLNLLHRQKGNNIETASNFISPEEKARSRLSQLLLAGWICDPNVPVD